MVSIKKASDNVFADLGFGNAEAQSLQRKADAIANYKQPRAKAG
jgi:hypothetical protein